MLEKFQLIKLRFRLESEVNMNAKQAKKIIEVEKSWESDNRKIDAFNMAIKTLEKQIPKKPKKRIIQCDLLKRVYSNCPNCSKQLTDWCYNKGKLEHKVGSKHKFCLGCGQMLDWSEEE